MNKLFNIIKRIRFLLAVLFFQFIAFLLIANGSGFQRTSIVNSANNFSGWFYIQESNLKNYLSLSEINNRLNEENALLKQKILRNYQIISKNTIKINNDTLKLQYEYIPAKVIRNSTNSRHNILTLNIGSSNGIEKEMGVITPNGIVGFVKDVSENFCTVISAMNKDFKITTRPTNQDLQGTFSWKDNNKINEGTVNNLESYVNISIGDTMVTRQDINMFPEGEILGFVTEITTQPGSNFKTLKIKTAQDFYALNHVFVVNFLLKNELGSISKNQNL